MKITRTLYIAALVLLDLDTLADRSKIELAFELDRGALTTIRRLGEMMGYSPPTPEEIAATFEALREDGLWPATST